MSTPGKELRIVYLSMCISAFIIMPLLFSFPFSREVVLCSLFRHANHTRIQIPAWSMPCLIKTSAC